MTSEEFGLLNAVLADGLDNTSVVVAEDIASTAEYFGTEEDCSLRGRYLVVYAVYGETMPNVERLVADYEMTLADGQGQYLRIFSLNG